MSLEKFCIVVGRREEGGEMRIFVVVFLRRFFKICLEAEERRPETSTGAR
jgi:hypothetical protein